MGFFNKLKKRLFTLDIEEPKRAKKLVKTEKAISSTEDKFSNKKILQVQKKVKKSEEKTIKSRLRKEDRINKYVQGMSKSGFSLSQKIKELQTRHNKIDEEYFDDLEDILIMADISANLVMEIILEIKKSVKIENVQSLDLISEIIADKLFSVYANRSTVDTSLNVYNKGLNVILVVGVNGSGKTTTIAKLSNKFKNEGKKVLIAAGDTFRAGAVEQLGVWAKRVGVEIVKPLKEGSDPASVVFDSLKKAKEGKYDILIVDTAGRLQNKVNLMKELEKINRIIQKYIPEAPHESLLVLDATTGQNGVLQAKHFKDVTPLTGIVLTKMDGTSKGGIILTIKDQLELSVKMVGLGEKIDDLQEFDLDAFIYGLTKNLMEDGNDYRE